ncbi:hypothetical protein B0H15DRAFT_956724 [Mycena belliarum]|uniref:BZIP domain-containing protein n=1 Tax=Mycena belliarum TaxID=1033014 RepID=A0AAD6TRM5_9AGAR|nr:hypothetical protein B0H15DRAFT_956724 [Mycena belliae]
MSSKSKRGRKRDDTLPPRPGLNAQRAFRARRAAHLQALEQRVTELEEENAILRQALDLPESSRSLLGSGLKFVDPEGKPLTSNDDGEPPVSDAPQCHTLAPMPSFSSSLASTGWTLSPPFESRPQASASSADTSHET